VLLAVSRLPENELQAALDRLVASELVFHSSTRWYRTQRTAHCCAARGNIFMRRSPRHWQTIPPS
jgi:hypothetical protein